MARDKADTQNRLDIYTEVTQRIVAEVESGNIPWTRPWATRGVSTLPHNAHTGRRYSGINVLLLWIAGMSAGYGSAGWMTYRQAQEAGGHVRKGERGTQVVMASTYVPKNEQDRARACNEDPRAVPFLKRFTVFNRDQIEGIADAGPEVDQTVAQIANADLDAFVAATGVDIRFGGDKAYYVPSLDYIQCPPPSAFATPEDLFRIEAHEMAHWSGAEHRLARTFGKRFGDDAYQMEELVAEIAAAQLCAVMGVASTTRHAAYIQHWLRVMKSDRQAIFIAARHASAAVEFLLQAAGRANDDAAEAPEAMAA